MYEDIEREEPLPSPGTRIPSARVDIDVRDELVRKFNIGRSRKRDSFSSKKGHSIVPFNVRQHGFSTVKLLVRSSTERLYNRNDKYNLLKYVCIYVWIESFIALRNYGDKMLFTKTKMTKKVKNISKDIHKKIRKNTPYF